MEDRNSTETDASGTDGGIVSVQENECLFKCRNMNYHYYMDPVRGENLGQQSWTTIYQLNCIYIGSSQVTEAQFEESDKEGGTSNS